MTLLYTRAALPTLHYSPETVKRFLGGIYALTRAVVCRWSPYFRVLFTYMGEQNPKVWARSANGTYAKDYIYSQNRPRLNRGFNRGSSGICQLNVVFVGMPRTHAYYVPASGITIIRPMHLVDQSVLSSVKCSLRESLRLKVREQSTHVCGDDFGCICIFPKRR